MTSELDSRMERFRSGFSTGYQVGWGCGFWNGCGHEKDECGRCLERALPPDSVVLDGTIADILRVALLEKQGNMVKLLTTEEVAREMLEAHGSGRGLSVVRIGESESLVLGQEVVLSPAQIITRGNDLLPAISGVTVPDLDARDMLVQSVKKADIVGIPTPLLFNHLPLTHAALTMLGVNIAQLRLTSSVINYSLLYEGHLAKLLLGLRLRVVCIGNAAKQLADTLSRAGAKVTGVVSPVQGMKDIDRVMAEVSRLKFDIALVPAAIPAVVICQRIATELGRLALDFGHCADQLASGSVSFQPAQKEG